MKRISFDSKKNLIAEKLRMLRVKEGISQGQLAARMQTLGVNLDQQMISKIETNSRMVTDYELACFCLALHSSPLCLLEDFFREYSQE